MKVYIAAPLFSTSEQNFNLELKSYIEEKGFDTYLPQFHGGILSDMLREGIDLHEAKHILFERDLKAIYESQIVLFLLDGRVPDEGGCVEVGIAFALGKVCIGFKTDARSFIANEDNVMISGVLNNQIARSFDELGILLLETARRISEK